MLTSSILVAVLGHGRGLYGHRLRRRKKRRQSEANGGHLHGKHTALSANLPAEANSMMGLGGPMSTLGTLPRPQGAPLTGGQAQCVQQVQQLQQTQQMQSQQQLPLVEHQERPQLASPVPQGLPQGFLPTPSIPARLRKRGTTQKAGCKP